VNRFKKTCVSVTLALGLLDIGVTGCEGGIAAAAPSHPSLQQGCEPRFATAGTEHSIQHDASALAQTTFTDAVQIQEITISDSYAQRGNAPLGFSEQLMWAGFSQGPPPVDASGFPISPVDPSLGNLTVKTSDGSRHNENNTWASGVWASRIIKSNGSGAASTVVDKVWSKPLQLAAGTTAWFDYGSISPGLLDPELQVSIQYLPAGCP
jgi:hypothetical protein